MCPTSIEPTMPRSAPAPSRSGLRRTPIVGPRAMTRLQSGGKPREGDRRTTRGSLRADGKPDAVSAPARTLGDRPALAVAAILVSVFALSLGDAVIKRTSVSLPLWQLYVLRSALIVPVLVGAIALRGTRTSFRPLAPTWVLLRSLLLTLMWIVYYAALPRIELSVAAAAYYTAPLIIMLLTSRLSRDRTTPALGVAVALGFAGVLVMLRPGPDSVDAWTVLPLLAAILYALAMLVTRERCAAEHPIVLALALNLAFIAVGGIATLTLIVLDPGEQWASANRFLFGDWVVLGAGEWAALGVLAAAMLIGSVGAAVAYQSGPAPLVASFDYAYLVFAGLWGYAFFNEVPDALAMTGMLMILLAGVLALVLDAPARARKRKSEDRPVRDP